MAFGAFAVGSRSLLLATALAALGAPAHAETRTLGPTTYTVPDGGQTQAKRGAATTHVFVDEARGSYAMFTVYEPNATAGSLEADFAADWGLFAKEVGGPTPSERGPISRPGWTGLAGVAAYTFDGKAGELIVGVFHDGQRRVSVASMTSDPVAWRTRIDAFFKSVALAAPAALAAPTTPVAPAVAPTPPAPAAGGAVSAEVGVSPAPVNGMRASEFPGWYAVEEPGWVHVRSLRTGLVARVHAGGPDDGGAAWQQLIAPRFPSLGAPVTRPAASEDRGRTFLSAQGRDAKGALVNVALYRRPGWPWIEVITPDRAFLHANLTTIYDGAGTSWSSLDQLARFDKRAATAAQLVGTWHLGGAGTLSMRADGNYTYRHHSRTDPAYQSAGKHFSGENLDSRYYMDGDWALYFWHQRIGETYPWATRLVAGARGPELWLSYGGMEVGPFIRAR